MTSLADGMTTIRRLGLTAYRRAKSCNKWLLPVCALDRRTEVDRLNPNHPNNWEEVDLDGCPTLCYCFTGRELKVWNKLPFTAVWQQFEDRLGKGPAKAFFPDLWLKHNNIRAHNRNTWEQHHGGLRHERFNRGPSVRAAAVGSLI